MKLCVFCGKTFFRLQILPFISLRNNLHSETQDVCRLHCYYYISITLNSRHKMFSPCLDCAHLAPPPPSTSAMLFPVRTRASREKSLCLSAVFSNTFSYTSLCTNTEIKYENKAKGLMNIYSVTVLSYCFMTMFLPFRLYVLY